MRRTVVDARRSLEQEVVPRVSDAQRAQFEEILAAEEQRAHKSAEQLVAGETNFVIDQRTDVMRELTDVRDAFDELDAVAEDGRMSAAEYTEQLNELHRRQVVADDRLAELHHRVDYVEACETDPLAWFSDLQRRIPRLMTEVPW